MGCEAMTSTWRTTAPPISLCCVTRATVLIREDSAPIIARSPTRATPRSVPPAHASTARSHGGSSSAVGASSAATATGAAFFSNAIVSWHVFRRQANPLSRFRSASRLSGVAAGVPWSGSGGGLGGFPVRARRASQPSSWASASPKVAKSMWQCSHSKVSPEAAQSYRWEGVESRVMCPYMVIRCPPKRPSPVHETR